MKLRVAHVVLQLDTGGMEKLLVEFARHADRDRFDLRFISISTRGPIASELEACGWSVIALNEPPGVRPGLILRLAKIFRDVDVVHLHNSKPLIYGVPAAKLARVRGIVYTRHGQRYLAGRRSAMLVRLALRGVDHVVSVSHDAARLSVEQGMPAAKIRTIWNGIDTRQFKFTGPKADGPVIFVGRLNPEKDVAALVRAAALAARDFPDLRVEIAGNGPCFDDVQKLMAELGETDRIRLLGEVRDVPSLMARARMLVLSSRTEGLPLTLLEAMACGLPVIATRVGGTTEAIVTDETGLIVPAGDPRALATAMLQLLRDPATAARLGRAGRLRAETYFDCRRMVGDYELLYAGLARGRAAALDAAHAHSVHQ